MTTTLEKLLLKFPYEQWNWMVVSGNSCVSLKFIEMHPELPWNYYGLSSNENITPEFIEKNINKPWDFNAGGLSLNPGISQRFVEKHINRSWDFGEVGLSLNPSITTDFVELHPDKPWDYSELGLSNNPNVTSQFIEKYLDKPWVLQKPGRTRCKSKRSGNISRDPSITYDRIVAEKEKFDFSCFGLSGNKFEKDPDMMRYNERLMVLKLYNVHALKVPGDLLRDIVKCL